jgi:hypothetical protein
MFDLMDAIANLQTVFAVAAIEAGRDARRPQILTSKRIARLAHHFR